MGNTAIDPDAYDTLGYVRVTWDNSDESAGHEAWRIYRRDNDAISGWVFVYQEDDLQASYTFDDYLAPANRDLDYAVVEVTTGNVEGAYTPVATVAVGTNYWLIDDTDSAYSFRIEHVTGESFNDEHEEDTLKLIGRGRKREVGTRWGYAGNLSLQIKPKNNKTSLQQLIELRTLKNQVLDEIYLRNPFGDVFKVSIGVISHDRVAGTGTDEHINVSFPYEEIA